jgi:putative endonuclease
VDRRKQERLRTAAGCYLAAHELEDAPARFDVAEVYQNEQGAVLQLQYIEDAFS